MLNKLKPVLIIITITGSVAAQPIAYSTNGAGEAARGFKQKEPE